MNPIISLAPMLRGHSVPEVVRHDTAELLGLLEVDTTVIEIGSIVIGFGVVAERVHGAYGPVKSEIVWREAPSQSKLGEVLLVDRGRFGHGREVGRCKGTVGREEGS